VRAVSLAGAVHHVAGSGAAAFADGFGSAASFNSPWGIAADALGTVYVSDAGNHRVRAVLASGAVRTLAGSGQRGWTDGSADGSAFDGPAGLALGGDELYVADAGNRRVRAITLPGGGRMQHAADGEAVRTRDSPLERSARTRTLAGSGAAGWADGAGSAASFVAPVGMATDAAGNIYVADTGAHRIARISPAGVVITLAGNGGVAGWADGPGSAALFNSPAAVAVSADGSRVYVADTRNAALRLLSCPASAHAVRAEARSAAAALASSLPPPPDAYVSGLLGLPNLAFGANVFVSSISAGGAATAAINYATDVPLFESYAQQCAVAYGAGFQSAGGGDATPHYQVDLGAPAVVTDVQLWATVGYAAWLAPISVFVTNSSSFDQTSSQPCYVFSAPDATTASLQHTCLGLGRYVTLALLANNTAAPQEAVLRFCALLVFGAFAPAPPPPLPPPAPPQAPPAPGQPFTPLQWWLVLIVLCLCLVLCAILLGAVAQCCLLRRRGAHEHAALMALLTRNEALRLRLKAQQDYDRVSAYYERQAQMWPSLPRAAQSTSPYDDGIVVEMTGIRTTLSRAEHS
jgi:DNA-binding beta-propeller fold protein YncE